MKLNEVAFSPMRRWKGITPDKSYLYHATNDENVFEIAKSRLIPHGPSYGTDQETWPDGSVEKRSYFTSTPATAEYFAPTEGKPVLLRVLHSASNFKRESTGDFYTVFSIPSSKIDILMDDGEWKPLKNIGI